MAKKIDSAISTLEAVQGTLLGYVARRREAGRMGQSIFDSCQSWQVWASKKRQDKKAQLGSEERRRMERSDQVSRQSKF